MTFHYHLLRWVVSYCGRQKHPAFLTNFLTETRKFQLQRKKCVWFRFQRARLKPGMIVYDIGCGSGSMSVEAALQVEDSGHVHAVDYDPKAVELTKKNLVKFGIPNVSVIGNNANEAISELPNADAIFVGGTGKDTNGNC